MGKVYVPRVYTPGNIRELDGRESGFLEGRYFREELIFHNDSDVPVYIVGRDGLVHYIPCIERPGPHKNLVFQRVIYAESNSRRYPPDANLDRVIFDCNDLIVSDRAPYSTRTEVQHVLQKSLINCHRGHATDGIATGFHLHLTAHELRTLKTPIYIPEVDLVVCPTQGFDPTSLFHPHSPKGRTLENMRSPRMSVNYANFLACIEIVDNECITNGRWVNFSGMVFWVEPITDVNRSSGVYFTHVPEGGGEFDVNRLQVKQFDLTSDSDDMPIKLWRTRDEALTFGDPKSLADKQHREELERLRQEKQAADIELLNMKRKADRDRAQWEQEKSRMDKEKAMRDEKAAKAGFFRRMADHWATIASAVLGVTKTLLMYLSAAK